MTSNPLNIYAPHAPAQAEPQEVQAARQARLNFLQQQAYELLSTSRMLLVRTMAALQNNELSEQVKQQLNADGLTLASVTQKERAIYEESL